MIWVRPALAVSVLIALSLTSTFAWAGPVRSRVEAQGMVQALLAGRTHLLKIGTVREVGQSYEVEVVTPGGTLVDRLLVEKFSGRLRSLYGQMLLSLQPTGSSHLALVPGGS